MIERDATSAIISDPVDPMDEHWLSDYGLPVPDGPIRAVLPYQGLLIVGGSFQRVGDLESPGIAAWDGTGWSGLGSFPGGHVTELAEDSGGLLALDDTPTVWRWNGADWQPLAPFPDGASQAFDMAVHEGRISVAVNTPGDHPRSSRVLLDSPDGWISLGGDFDDVVFALAWNGDALFAGGWFHTVDGRSAPLAAVWDGVAWNPASAGLPANTGGYVRDLAMFDGSLVACGTFFDTLGTGPRFVARWTGGSWAPLGAEVPGYLVMSRLRPYGSDLYVVGSFLDDRTCGIARWDGTTWHAPEDSLIRSLYDVALYQGQLYAAGALSNDGSLPASSLVRQHGNRWESPLAPTGGMQGLTGAFGPDVRGLAATDSSIVVAGTFEFAGQPPGWLRCPRAASWDGTAWSSLGMERWFASTPFDLALGDSSIYVVGSFADAFEHGSVAQFVNGTWHLQSRAGVPFPNPYCITAAFGGLCVGGQADTLMGGIAYWDGVEWYALPRGLRRGRWITAIAAHDGELVVGGSFDSIGTVAARNIAAWSWLSGWHALGEGVSRPVTDLISHDRVLYASTEALFGAPAVRSWTHGSWGPLPLASPSGGSVSTLGWYRGRLVASGYGMPGRLASLDPDSTWHPLGSGLNGIALSLVESGPSLFVGGQFSRAGGHAAYGFAEWRDSLPIPPAPRSVAEPVTIGPNPFAFTLTLRYALEAGAQTRIEVYDLAGRLVDQPLNGYQSAGPQEFTWRPDTGRIRAGVYFVRLVTPAAHPVVRVVRVY
jgi:hypothetical protein